MYLLTYTLVQDNARLTCRATIWEKTADGWKVVYNSGNYSSGSLARHLTTTARANPSRPLSPINCSEGAQARLFAIISMQLRVPTMSGLLLSLS